MMYKWTFHALLLLGFIPIIDGFVGTAGVAQSRPATEVETKPATIERFESHLEVLFSLLESVSLQNRAALDHVERRDLAKVQDSLKLQKQLLEEFCSGLADCISKSKS